MPSSTDTLRMLLAQFVSVASDSTVLGLLDLAWLLRLVKTEWNFLNHHHSLNKCFCYFHDIMTQFEITKHKFPN